MIIQFKVANHRSLRDEQQLSLAASSDHEDDLALYRAEHLEAPILPVAAIYGANASGKSNVFHALTFAMTAVVSSQRRWEPDQGIQREAFALGGAGSNPSSYVIDFMLDGVRNQYGFSVTDQQVVEEWLYVWPNGRQTILFTRDRQLFTFGRELKGENKTIEALTRKNSLFLSAAAQNNHERLMPAYEWFARNIRIVRLDSANLGRGFVSPWWTQFDGAPDMAEQKRNQVRRLLSSADLGILDFKVDEIESSTVYSFSGAGDSTPSRRKRLLLQHRGATNNDPWFGLAQESTGTNAIIRMIPALLDVLESGGVLVLDELNSLHPMLSLEIIRLFQNKRTNLSGAQLLFNTHDLTLLGNMLDGPQLQRDQIWFTEKDKSGATHLYPLSDYHPRSAENLERGYLQGRYGGIPFLGPLDVSRRGSEEE
jgi:hypothetical protein